MKQKTIAKSIEINDIGLHSGLKTKIVLNPSKLDTGIIFRFFNKDEDGAILDSSILQATYNNVIDTRLGTTIGNKELTVLTIEHLMSALWACDIDNVVIEIFSNKQEIPILDGSATLFIKQIKDTGIQELPINRKFINILKTIEVKQDDSFIRIEPNNNFSIDMSVEFNYGNIGKQQHYFNGNQEDFIENISKARTFCNEKEIEFMKQNNLAKGGSLDNAMVFNENSLINSSGFIYENEVVKHKILDCVGDLFTSGYFIKGKVIASKTGHTLNNKLLRELFKDKENYNIH
jgi:UDP-3-O-[3-hydroxymyristoyl] N-acetylglucosamine deacetylase